MPLNRVRETALATPKAVISCKNLRVVHTALAEYHQSSATRRYASYAMPDTSNQFLISSIAQPGARIIQEYAEWWQGRVVLHSTL